MQSTAAATTRNHQLDGLRGYAAMAVVVFHSLLCIDSLGAQRIFETQFQSLDGLYPRLTKVALAIFNGEAAVLIFFVMSGAVLMQSLRRDTAGDVIVMARFIVRRLLRIFPGLIACLLFAVALFSLVNVPWTAAALLTNMSLTAFPIIGPSWTLQVELLAVPLLLAGALVFRRWQEIGLLLLIVMFLTLMRHSPLSGIFPMFSWFALCFSLGMFVPTSWGERIAEATPRFSWPLFLAIALFAKHAALFGPSTTGTIQHVAAALLVNSVYYGKAPGLDRILRTKFAAFFGRISYALYLANAPILDTGCAVFARYPVAASHPLEAGLIAGLIFITLATPVAYAVTVWIEEPAIRLGRRLTKSRAISAGVAYPPLS